jgi:hypothetical protein
MILTAGVVVAGVAILYWAYSWGAVANHEYSNAVDSSSNAIGERIAFEYITYSNLAPQNLTVYIINCGQTNNVSIARVYISNSTWVGTTLPSPTLMSTANPNQTLLGLDMTDEGFFNVTTTLGSGSYYTIHLVTQRGRNFDGVFSTP